MVDFSKKNTKESGGKFADKDWTFNGTTWAEITSSSGSFTGIYIQTNLEGVDGKAEEKRWLLGDAGKLYTTYGLKVSDDGTLEKVDDDKPDYTPRTNDETSQLFNSMEDAGVSAKVLQSLDSNPGALDGYTFHLVDKPTGKKQTKKVNGVKVETDYDQTWLVVDADGLVSTPDGGTKKKAAAGKPFAAAAGKAKKPAPVEEEEEEETPDVDPIEQAAIATIQAVLARPKKFIPTFNAKQNGGGVTTAQMRLAAQGNAKPKEYANVSKADVSKLLGKPDLYVQYHGELWSFDAEEGVVSKLDE